MSGKISGIAALAGGFALTLSTFSTHAAGFSSIYQFKGGKHDGAYPVANLISDKNGNLYGTTLGGGGTGCKIGCGIVFKLSPSSGSWTESVLHVFKGSKDGAVPLAGVIIDATGNLYGTTSQGGGVGCNGEGCGTVFKLAPDGTESILASFAGGSDGQDPRAALALDSLGNLYGTTAEGGITTCGYFQTGCGTLFEIPSGGTRTTLYAFGGSLDGDGESPRAALVINRGNLYGTTMSGGSTDNSGFCVYESCGTVFEFVPGGGESVLYRFKGGAGDGGNPVSSVIFDQNGNLDGTTLYGGSSDCFGYGCGTVFQLPISGGETLLHTFLPSDGEAPVAGLIADTSGNFDSVACGETCNGGKVGGARVKNCARGCQYGTVYRIPADGTKKTPYSIIYKFDRESSAPSAPLLMDTNTGTLYGTTQNGGNLSDCPGNVGCGTVFSIVSGRN